MRCETEYLVAEHFQLGVLEKFLGPRRIIKNFQEFAEPTVLLPVTARIDLFEGPMRGDAKFSLLMHLASANLYLDALALWAHDTRVQRAVTIGLGCADIVLELVWHHRIGAMDKAKRPVAVGDIFNNYAKSDDVRQLLEGDVFDFHFAPDRI